MPENLFVILNEPGQSSAVIAPALGGWLLRYSRRLPSGREIDVLHYSPAVVDRYPREMYAGIPVLFPLVSYNHLPGQEHHFEWEGQIFGMPQHGFARRLPWSIVDQSLNALTMELTDTDVTRRDYPFAFSFRLTYRLNAGRLEIDQAIQNRSDKKMPFSTGLHPYFAVPFTGQSSRDQCFVRVPAAKRASPVGASQSFELDAFPSQLWPVQNDVAATLFLADLAKREFGLVDSASKVEAIFNYEGAPRHRFAALWSKSQNEPYYCIEPWTALPNSFTRAADGELILLNPGESFTAGMWIDVQETGPAPGTK